MAWVGTSLKGAVPIPRVSRLRRELCFSLSRQETVLAAGTSLRTALPMKYLCCCSFPGHSISSTSWTPLTICRLDCLQNIPVTSGLLQELFTGAWCHIPRTSNAWTKNFLHQTLALSAGKHDLVLGKSSSKHIQGFLVPGENPAPHKGLSQSHRRFSQDRISLFSPCTESG